MAQDADRPVAPQVADRSSAAPGVAGPDGSADTDEAYGRRWLILGVVCLGQLIVVLDAMVVNIALPTAQHDLAFSNADRQRASLPPADRFHRDTPGHRRGDDPAGPVVVPGHATAIIG